ncbi:biogenesis of lysosome-related organelles complex 1 subunit 4-like isoform X2 [Apostichopus japonicus]|uniref:biogenesis of lysosome-related organelles complex 1 subunit 4-like isoform X2 n=1 Tax=Stichopus japonicus TaxID=307972 RepID=UPI003AB6710D
MMTSPLNEDTCQIGPCQRNHLDEKIEELLTRLDEFCAVVDIIRTDSSLALNRSLPEVHAKSKELESVFQKVDDLEKFVSLVKKDVMVIEEQVNTAEKDLGTLTSVKNLIMSFPLFSQKRTRNPAHKPLRRYVPPEIFRTEDYIAPEEQRDQSGEG